MNAPIRETLDDAPGLRFSSFGPACIAVLGSRQWRISFAAGLFGSLLRSYPSGVALIPKVKVGGKPMAILAIIAALIGLSVIPVLTAAAMVLVGVGWGTGPRWARVTLIVGAVLYVAYRITTHAPLHHG